jgi:hypothetical protein
LRVMKTGLPTQNPDQRDRVENTYDLPQHTPG